MELSSTAYTSLPEVAAYNFWTKPFHLQACYNLWGSLHQISTSEIYIPALLRQPIKYIRFLQFSVVVLCMLELGCIFCSGYLI
jgi:hypothetical protein